MNLPKLLVALALHDPVDASHADVMRSSTSNPEVDGVERMGSRQRTDRDTQHVESICGRSVTRHG